MRTQLQMLNFLNENVDSHTIASEGNKIIAKPLFRSSSFATFKVTYMKNGNVSLNTRGVTSRYNSDDEMIQTIGSVASIKEEVYKNACNNLAKEFHKTNIEKLINDEALKGYVYGDLLEIFNLKQKHIKCFKKMFTTNKEVSLRDFPEFNEAYEDLKQAISFELVTM